MSLSLHILHTEGAWNRKMLIEWNSDGFGQKGFKIQGAAVRLLTGEVALTLKFLWLSKLQRAQTSSPLIVVVIGDILHMALLKGYELEKFAFLDV